MSDTGFTCRLQHGHAGMHENGAYKWAGTTGPRCPATHGKMRCARPAGHDGMHEACKTWRQRPPR